MQLKHMSASIIENNGVLVLVSYSTPVVLYARGNIILGSMWDCSVTTLKHVKTFLTEFTYLKYCKDKVNKAFLLEQIKQGKIGTIDSIAY